MSNDKKLSAIEALEQKHAEAIEARKAAIAAALKDVRDYEAALKEATEKVRQLQAENMNASFAFDAERTRLLEAEKPKAA
jgi:hypothetical protein